MDNLPQLWTNGYLIAVDTMYLGGEWFNRMVATEDMTISVIMECTVDTLSKEAAMGSCPIPTIGGD